MMTGSSRYIFANKPSGITTHRVSPEKPGFCEWLEKKLDHSVFVVHRLDKETTGSVLFANSHEEAGQLAELFANHHIHKKYLFITDRQPLQNEWTTSSLIEKNGKVMTSKKMSPNSPEANSHTSFKVIKNFKKFFLIEASPKTGKTHQIRLHAKDSETPLLGDTLYGGTKHSQFFLHSLSLQSSDGQIHHQCEPPLIYQNLELLERPLLCQWLMSYDRRARLYPELVQNIESCLRLIHTEGTPLRVDKLGPSCSAGWWDEIAPTQNQMKDVEQFFKIIGIDQWSLQHNTRKKNNSSSMIVSQTPSQWIAQENGASYIFKHEIGNAPGLFLDQREHRRHIKNISKGKNVLNLFAYTGGFSLMAALGGANSVVTVDLSKKYIQWAKDNFTQNNLSPENFKFYDMDSIEYLKYAFKKSLLFDVIICDPPSFSRNNGKTFQIDRDFKDLIHKMKILLAPGGQIFFSTNFEQWSLSQWQRELALLEKTEDIEITDNFSLQWDFEVDPHSCLMKAFQIKKEVIA